MSRFYIHSSDLPTKKNVRWELADLNGYIGTYNIKVWGIPKNTSITVNQYATYWDYIAELTNTRSYALSTRMYSWLYKENLGTAGILEDRTGEPWIGGLDFTYEVEEVTAFYTALIGDCVYKVNKDLYERLLKLLKTLSYNSKDSSAYKETLKELLDIKHSFEIQKPYIEVDVHLSNF